MIDKVGEFHVRRYITCFEKEVDELKCEIDLLKDDMKELREIFNQVDDECLFDCFEVTPIFAEALYDRGWIGDKLDLTKYQCFLECERHEAP